MGFNYHPSRWMALVAALALFFVVLSSKVRYTAGDSRFTLLASQALLEHGSLRLDPYNERFGLWDANDGKLWMIFKDTTTGHSYYDYPVGTPIFATPFVAMGLAVGLSPINKYDDTDMQMLIASTTLVFVFLLLFQLSLLYLGDWEALLFALMFTFGTSLMSTLGTALWSQNFQVIFILLALLELANVLKGKRVQVRGGWLGAWLFAAYLCRPTSAPLIVVVFGYLAWKHRKALPWAAGVSGGLMLLFMLWSRIEMGRMLPRYYSPDNWEPYGDYIHTLWPILLGPARGLFSFTPVLCLLFVGFAFAKLRKEPLFWAIWLWLTLLTVVILRSKNPWGGWCYGPRFYTEILPGLAWLLLMTLEAAEGWALRWRKTLGFVAMATSLMGIYIHTWQGAYSPVTSSWNGEPNIDENWPSVRWDWRYPQFMASYRQIGQHTREREIAGLAQALLAKVPAGGALLMGAPNPDVWGYFDFWNRTDRLHTGKFVFNTLLDVQEAGFKDFWFERALYFELRNRPTLRLDPIPVDSILGPDSVMVAVPNLPLCHGYFLTNDQK